MTTRQALEIAFQHHQAGRLAEAEAMYRQILAAEPNHVDALHYLGILAQQVGRHDLALQLIRRGLLLQPDDARAHANLGEVLRLMGRPDEAIGSLRRALELQPDFPEALNNLSAAFTARGDHEQALVALRRAVEIDPRYATGFNNLGFAFLGLERWDEAIAASSRAIEIDPQLAESHNNLGIALSMRGRREESAAAFRSAVRWNPRAAESYDGLGQALTALGRVEEAIAAFRQALVLQPDSPGFHWNTALAMLSIGRFREGWEQYEWRVQLPRLARPDLTAPAWNGEDLVGRTLLIHQEGGFGDVIHFMRYLPMIRARGVGRILFEGRPAILPWMQMQPGIDQTLPVGDPLPPHDFHCAPQSFPRIFGTELHNIPASTPYLLVDSEKAAVWRRKLARPPFREESQQSTLLVGLCWAGSSHARADYRSRTLHTFAPLGDVPGITFVSLQKGPEASEAEAPPAGMQFVNAAAEVQDFSDLAALVSCLDVVVTVDTSVAHLSALGIPTWILIPHVSDFRWMLERKDSPWYPSARLFRQRDGGTWEEPVQEMVEALRHYPRSNFERRIP